MNPLAFLLVVGVSALITWFALIYARKHQVLDIPNARSSHSSPTPRGGGISIVITMLAVIAYLGSTAILPVPVAVGYFLAGVLVAGVGWVDDHGHVSSGVRLLVHFLAAALIVYSVGGLPHLIFVQGSVDLGLFGDTLALIAIVWMLNLYNFMDGIDGIAGVEAATATILGGWMLASSDPVSASVNLSFFMAASTIGFLMLNFPPAKIFMGDAGSGFLGLMLAALGLYSAHHDPRFVWIWLILFGVFVVDATFTLLRRLARTERVNQAHRSHAYQNASRRFGGHRPVTLSVVVINVCWLGPVALAVYSGKIPGVVALVVAYLPLVGLAIYLKAGARED